jgi:hypothetical protein
MISARAWASDIYVAQNAAGANSGGDCADAHSATWLNTASNWGSGGGQIGPGTTVHLCGVFTIAAGSTMLTAQGSGTSGNPITILFESGAIVQAPYFSTTSGAINLSGRSYLTIDGGSNGILQSTANGTALANQVDGNLGIVVNSTANITIRNLAINNFYVRVADTSGNTGFNSAAINGSNATNILVDTVSITNVKTGVGIAFSASGSNYEVRNSYFFATEVPTILATGTANVTFTNVLVHNNNFAGGDDAWDDPVGNSFHHDGGGHYWAQASNAHIVNLRFYNNWIHGIWGNDAAYFTQTGGTHITSWVYPEDTGGDVWLYNNVFDMTSGDIRYQSGDNGTIFCKGNGSPGMQCHFFNNVILGPSGNTKYAVGYETDGYSGDIVKNNIFMNLGMAFYLAGAANSTITSDNNVCYNIGSSGWNFGSYANWRSSGQDADSPPATNVNPNLNANYIPQAGSNAIGAAINLTPLNIVTLDSDKAGASRPPSGSWDAGSYQASAVPPPTGLVANVH